MTSRAEIRSLYVHIPFCERKCGYCDFASVAGVRGQHRYAGTLMAELTALGEAFPGTALETVFFGGGTPGLLDLTLMAGVMDRVRAGFTIAPGAEVTLEANPSSTSERRAAAWLEAGFNRVSIGVQSLEPGVLRFLDRVHDAGRALSAVDEVRAAGFQAISCDLIYAVPGLDDAAWIRTVERVLEKDPGHLSAYELTVEPGTPLAGMVDRGETRAAPAPAALRQHRLAADALEAAGYRQYEVSNYARPGRQSRHNLAYWTNGYYLAAGAGAHGHLPASAAGALGIAPGPGAAAVRHWHPRDLAAYNAGGGSLAPAGWEAVSAGQREAERIMLGLRLNSGVDVGRLHDSTVAADLVGAGLLQRVGGGRVAVTGRGREVLNEVALRLVEAASVTV